MSPQAGIMLAWAAWIVSWLAAAAWSSPAVARPDWRSEMYHRVPVILGAILLFAARAPQTTLGRALSEPGSWAGWTMVALAVAGSAFTWWARVYLGRLWSASVTRKEGHRVVDTGPYAIVRHPIYTGITLAAFATAAVRGTAFALAGAIVMTVGWCIKAKIEERFLRQQLGVAEYDAYAARVPMLVPFTRRLWGVTRGPSRG